jgi:hypothetical protein
MPLTPNERHQKIESYGLGVAQLTDALPRFPVEMWTFKPSPRDWSIHEIIIHLADSETNSYGRFRRAIAEPGSSVFAYDQDVWAIQMDYHAQSTDLALSVLKAVRASIYALLKMQPDEVFANWVMHPENGRVTLDDILTTYEAHIPGHIRQMEDNYEVWCERTGKQP